MRRTVRKPQIRLITALLAAAVVFSSCPAAALAEETPVAEPDVEVLVSSDPADLALPEGVIEEAAAEAEALAAEDPAAAEELAPFAFRRLSAVLPEGALTDSFGAVSAVYYPAAGEYLLDYESAEAAAAAYEQLCAAWGTDRILPDLPVTAQWEQFDVTEAYSNSWGADMMQLDTARDRANADSELTERITVAVLDSGVNPDHECFAGRLSDAANSFVGDETYPTDTDSHGTHVAGIIADATPEQVEILPLKVLSGGTGGFTEMRLAIYYAIEHGADVINMSFGVNLTEYNKDMTWSGVQRAEAAYAAAEAAGCYCVVAASNDNGSIEELISYPAISEHVVTVTSIDRDRERAVSSNYGAAADFTAPGVAILSAGLAGLSAYIIKNGTSMACPHVAAAAAMLSLYNPKLNNAGITELLLSVTEDLGDEGWDPYFGYGLPVFPGGEIPVAPFRFADVTDPETFWYEPVYWAVGRGVVTGWEEADGTATFRPWNDCNRAAIVAFLWRLAGCPEPETVGVSPFTDVDETTPFYEAILWATQQGIVTGWTMPDGTAEFRPWNTCNRAAVVAFLWRLANCPEPEAVTESPFADADETTPFYEAILWATQQGIVTGWEEADGTATFRPWNMCNRAAVVSFLYRYAAEPEEE